MKLKVFTVSVSGSDDMIKNLPEHFKIRAGFKERNFFNPNMKMREKTKLKTIEEIPFEELASQVLVEGEFIYCSQRYNMQQIICNTSYVRYITYHILHVECIFFSLASPEEELIIPEWFFKTTIVIEPERTEF